MLDIAVKRVRTAVVAGGGQFEPTRASAWYDESSGRRLPSSEVAKMHLLLWKTDSTWLDWHRACARNRRCALTLRHYLMSVSDLS